LESPEECRAPQLGHITHHDITQIEYHGPQETSIVAGSSDYAVAGPSNHTISGSSSHAATGHFSYAVTSSSSNTAAGPSNYHNFGPALQPFLNPQIPIGLVCVLFLFFYINIYII
jgi:hypothetical protein